MYKEFRYTKIHLARKSRKSGSWFFCLIYPLANSINKFVDFCQLLKNQATPAQTQSPVVEDILATVLHLLWLSWPEVHVWF